MTALLVVIKLLTTAAPLLACAVCAAAVEDANANAFLKGTAILSLMPLGVIGTTVFYIYRRTKATAAEQPAPEQQ